jgi:prolyl oligopeptidase
MCTVNPTLAAPDEDPFLWLEEIEGARALSWVELQSAATRARFGHADFVADRATLAQILNRADKLPFVARRGAHLYNFWVDEAHPRGLWRRTTLTSFRTPTPAWDVLLDVDALAAEEGEDWIWQGATTLPGTHDRAIVQLSRGGSDAAVLREFDLGTRGFVVDGFELGEAKGGIDWLDRDTLLLSSAYGGADMATTSGYARTVRLWRRGTAVQQAPVLFETAPTHMRVWASVDRTRGPETVWFADRPSFFETQLWLGDRTGPHTKLDLPDDCTMATHRDWLVVKRRSTWTLGGMTHAPDTLLGLPLAGFLAGQRTATVLFEPSDRRTLQSFFWTAGRLILAILDELKPVFEVLSPRARGWRRAPLQGLPTIGVVQVGPLDVEEDESTGDLLAQTQDPLTPPALALLKRGRGPQMLKQSAPTFDPSGLEVTNHQAISVDGEPIPYTQIGPRQVTGDAPVHMTGYGGFGIASQPVYNSAIGKLWLERGGISVIAHIRGGGEFGTRWHDAGRGAGKRLSHDDFAAVAADLVRRGITVPQRIAAEGGSNGGILITNMLVRYPERFGALFCTIPLIDMRRYAKLLAGASWIAEYGDPDKPEDWAYLRTYSAYHLAEAGQPYPPILIATTRKDDRVHPGHARKMAAKLQALGYDASYYEAAAGGHGYGKDNQERAAFTALGLTFLRQSIGWTV